VNWIKLADLLRTGKQRIVSWIKLADCYFVLGNRGLLAGLNWLTVAS
jgi:hypothetical protein